MRTLWISLVILFIPTLASGQSYQGFGAGTPGGAGQPVVHVTTLADSGPGSLRAAMSGGNRTIVFDVAGTINLVDHLFMRGAFVTIDGHTAPSPGITLQGKGPIIRGSEGAHDVIIRGLRVRDATIDGIQVAFGAYNVVLDHVSVANSADGNIDITEDSHDVTVSWSVIGPGGKNVLIKYGPSRVTLHHNVLAGNNRNPQARIDDGTTATATDTTLDMRNNVVMGWNEYGTLVWYGPRANIYANAYERSTDAIQVISARAFVNSNVLFNGATVGESQSNETRPFINAPVTTQDPLIAKEAIFASAGAMPRDAIDEALVGPVPPPQPPPVGTDLVIENAVANPATVSAGSVTVLSYRVANRGTQTLPATTSAPYRERVYLSTVPLLDASAVPLAGGVSHGHTEDLSPGETHASTLRPAIPTSTQPGAYYLLIEVDSDHRFNETSESNNVTAVPITVTGPVATPGGPAPTLRATYHAASVYWVPPGGGSGNVAQVEYRRPGAETWRRGHDLWWTDAEYRGSLVGLEPGTVYEVRVTLPTGLWGQAAVATRSENPFITKWIRVGPHTSTFTTTEGGSAAGWVLYDGTGATIDGEGKIESGVVVNHSFVIVRGFTIKNTRAHGVNVTRSDVIVEDNDISRWGDLPATCGGHNGNFRQGGIRLAGGLTRVTIQRNLVHEPNHGAKTWTACGGQHPFGPSGIFFVNPGGGAHVIRYNEITSTPDRLYYDGMKAEGDLNFTATGFPGPDSDIYQNIVTHAADDGIEADGGGKNVRIWGNYVDLTMQPISTAGIMSGPAYIFRNVVNRGIHAIFATQRPWTTFKVGAPNWSRGRGYWFHNTVLRGDDEGNDRFISSGISSSGKTKATGMVVMNNVGMTRLNFLALPQNPQAGVFDYNLRNRDNALIPEGMDVEVHGIKASAQWVSGHGPACGSCGQYQLRPGSPGHDGGTVIPNFSDGYSGIAPDMGAHEWGASPMRFGTGAAWP